MKTLKLGSTGPDVKALQKKLSGKGFNPGIVDGDFGPGTEAAVMAFQRSESILPDGIVGPKTAALLGIIVTPPKSDADGIKGKVNVAFVSKLFPFAPLADLKQNLPLILQALDKQGLLERNMVFMALATIRVETSNFRPIDEGISRFNSSPSGHPFDLYDNRQDLGNTGKPDGALFKGRGFIQLTGRSNYLTIGNVVNVDLIKSPALANDPAVAADILAVFLKKKELQIKQAILENDLRAARRLVNGGSHGLEEFSSTFRKAELLFPS